MNRLSFDLKKIKSWCQFVIFFEVTYMRDVYEIQTSETYDVVS